MNKNFLFTMIAAATLTGFTACSSDDSVEGGGENGAKGNQFITINIQDVGTTPSTRADENGAGSGEGAGTKDNKYENGLDNENSITQVKFYFFDAAGKAVNVNGAANTNSKLITKTNGEWGGTYTGNGTTTTDPETVERRTQATLVLENYDGTLPTQMVAVVNPQNYSTVLPDNADLSALKALTTTTLGATTAATGSATVANGYTDFAMTNSVYYGVTGETVADNPTLEVSCENKFKTTSEGALADPVNIYVERIAAKVRAKVTTAVGNEWTTVTVDDKAYPAYPIKDNNGVAQEYNGKQIYAVVYGWGLADEQETANDFKSLKRYNALNATDLGINHWTSGEFHRSFWEQIPTYSRVSHPWSYYTGRTFTVEGSGTLSWSDKSGADANSMASDSKDAVYTLPNTDEATYSWDDVNRNSSATAPTKVVVAARLMYNNGTDATPNWQPVERCVSGTYTYVGLTDFKTFIANNSGIYVKKSGESVYNTITAADIDFEAVTTDITDDGNYEVQATLKATEGAQYGTGNVNDPTALTTTQVSTRLNSFKALVYREGLTYYYTAIQHLGTPGENNATKGTIGAYGVVRNHLYDVTINGMTGFGTPVYDPERGIVPETPEDQNSYLAVSINVLQWRVVSQSVNIDGTSK